MYIKRDIENRLKKYIPSPEIIAVVGPRQSGKTTLLKRKLWLFSHAICRAGWIKQSTGFDIIHSTKEIA